MVMRREAHHTLRPGPVTYVTPVITIRHSLPNAHNRCSTQSTPMTAGGRCPACDVVPRGCVPVGRWTRCRGCWRR
jgi:hypothetical protein